MRVKIDAGAEFETTAPHEMKGILSDWLIEVGRGVKFRKAGGQLVLAGGVFSLTSTSGIEAGPRPGFVWSVTRVALAGGGFVPGTDTFSVFNGDPSSVTVMGSGFTRFAAFGLGEFVVNPADNVGLTGVGTGTGGTDIGVSIMLAEVPIQLAWQLLG